MQDINYWDKLRQVPDVAKKPITGGNLNGMTDINPVWRIQVMTENFGMCGFGWKYVVTKQWLEAYGNDVRAFCNIDLFVKVGDQWSDAIPGTGGASFAMVTNSGKTNVSDEAYKMALTDALSVAMKAIGVAADVYFANGARYETKYEQNTDGGKQETKKDVKPAPAPAAAAQPAPKKDTKPTPTPAPQAAVKPAPAPAKPAPAPQKAAQPAPAPQPAGDTPLEMLQKAFDLAKVDIAAAKSKSDLTMVWARYDELQKYVPFKEAMSKRKGEVPND